MAYMNQEKKKILTPAIKAVLKKYNMKASIGVNNHSTLVINIKSGELDLVAASKEGIINDLRNYDMNNFYDVKMKLDRLLSSNVSINEYWIAEYYEHSPIVRDFYLELKDAMEGADFYNHDDTMTDYFRRSHYIDIFVGNTSDYICTGETKDFTNVISELEILVEELKVAA